ncbi:NRDE-2, necessary for RNA interference-domain-containing protein [Tricharina praecox]|uniref:NRDE-2, necessary for RNA interference-domain-containing protein n=1 Tax=Tricharina praecox TaxID=43433 RepID=UPI00221E43D0|nr:NRDE-2, necessary for RNA interference-domain-containing protein [Tricharina praecox]KAI5858627.1 NRDE-2, necessary for RNA interference-domain-containing protein [Tricharina praecox]
MSTSPNAAREEGKAENRKEAATESSTRTIPKFSSFKALQPRPTTATPTLATKETPDETIREREKKREKREGPSRGKEKDEGRRGYRSHRSQSREHKHKRVHHERDKDNDRTDDEQRKRRHRHGDSKERTSHSRRGHDREKDDTARRRRRSRSREAGTTTTSLIPRDTAYYPEEGKEEPRDAPQKQYFVDTKGDEFNLVYGTMHRYSIPDYHRGGSGRIVGLSPNLRIDRAKGDGKVMVLSTRGGGGAGGEDSSVRAMRQAFSKLANKESRRLRIKKDETGLDEAFSRNMDFVPLTIETKKRKNRGEDVGSDDSDKEWDHYRSIEGLKKPSTRPDDMDLEYASDSASEADYISTGGDWGDRKSMVEFARKVEAEPRNAEAWLAYVGHHDTIISGAGRRKTAAEKRSTAEVQLDILQKALNKNPGHEALLSKYMDVAQEILPPQKLLSKWNEILKENPSQINLWRKFIDFRQTDFLSFSYPKCLKCYEECLAVLRTAAFRAGVGSLDRQALDEVIVYVFTRTILFMSESGYRESAIAALQAMLELNLFHPTNLTPPTSQLEFEMILEVFERFWDSEVPRIGEKKALGWASFVDAAETGTSPKASKDDLQLPPLEPRDPFGSWTDAELEWSRKTGMPARTIDEIDDDDPYRVILFSDIRPFLFSFSSETSRKRLAEAFLMLRGMPLVGPYCSNSEVEADVFLSPGMKFDSSELWFWPKEQSKWDALPITWEGMEPEKKAVMGDDPFGFKLRNFPVGSESLFNRSTGWFNGISSAKSLPPNEVQLIRNTLEKLVERLSDDSWSFYYLEWIWKNDPKRIGKAVSLCSKTIRVWGAVTQIRWHDSTHEEGRSIFSTSSKESSKSTDPNKIFMWHACIWEELFIGNAQRAIRLLLSIESGELLGSDENDENGPGPGNVSKLLLLKCRKYLEYQQHTMLSIKLNEHAGMYNDLRALLEYLAGGNNLDAAIAVYDGFTSELGRRSLTGPTSHFCELCLLRKVRLVYMHSTTARPFKPATLRSHLEAALEIFPHNMAFLSLYAWNESRTKIENRLRTVIRDRVLKDGNETVAGWLFAVWAEMRMAQHYNVHAVRHLFERAVECNRTRHSVQLWMMFVEFEIRHKEYRRAKDILSRGIKHCPWSKELVMMAFTKLQCTLELEESRKLLSIMSEEKELRTHDVTELEDLVEDLMDARRDGGGGLDGGADEDFIKLPDDDSDEEMEDE